MKIQIKNPYFTFITMRRSLESTSTHKFARKLFHFWLYLVDYDTKNNKHLAARWIRSRDVKSTQLYFIRPYFTQGTKGEIFLEKVFKKSFL